MFEFVSALRRMSVVVKRLKSTSMEIYVKGAPEVMVDICNRDSCVYNSSVMALSCMMTPLKFLRIMTICYRTTRNVDTESLQWRARVSRGYHGLRLKE
jgi:magnesium-transporting ATPase (P-type)